MQGIGAGAKGFLVGAEVLSPAPVLFIKKKIRLKVKLYSWQYQKCKTNWS